MKSRFRHIPKLTVLSINTSSLQFFSHDMYQVLDFTTSFKVLLSTVVHIPGNV